MCAHIHTQKAKVPAAMGNIAIAANKPCLCAFEPCAGKSSLSTANNLQEDRPGLMESRATPNVLA